MPDIQSDRRKGLLSLQFAEVSAHTRLAPRHSSIAEGQPFTQGTTLDTQKGNGKALAPALPYIVGRLRLWACAAITDQSQC